MTELDYIRNLPVKALAELLVQTKTVSDEDESYIDGGRYLYDITVYESYNGDQFDYWDEAVEDTIRSLLQEHI